MENETTRYGDVIGKIDLPFFWDVVNTMPTWGVGLLAVGIVFNATTIKLDQGETVALQNAFNGKLKGIAEGPGLVWKSPFTRARRYISETFNAQKGAFEGGQVSKYISTRERLFEIPSNTATTSDGVEVDYVLSAVLQVKDAEKFISVSENPLATVVRNLIREATPLFKQNTLDEVRSDRSEMEKTAIENVQAIANKYGIEIVSVSTSEPILNPEYAKELSLKAAAELRSKAAQTSGEALATKIKAVADGLGIDNKNVALQIAERVVAVETAANGGGNAVITMPTVEHSPVKTAEAIAQGDVNAGSKTNTPASFRLPRP